MALIARWAHDSEERSPAFMHALRRLATPLGPRRGNFLMEIMARQKWDSAPGFFLTARFARGMAWGAAATRRQALLPPVAEAAFSGACLATTSGTFA